METLRNSELRYRRLFEAAQDGILILDAETAAITDVNPFLIQMLGYSREEFVQKKLWEVGAFKDVEASQYAFETLQENEYIRYEDLPLRTKEGRLIQVEFVSNVYLAGDEKVIQCNIRDITEHRRIVNALELNERKYHDLINQSPDGYFIIEFSGKILTVNQTICNDLEYSEEEFLSMTIWDIIPDEYLDPYRKRLLRILTGESLAEAAEYEVRGKNGKIHYVEVLSAPHYSGKEFIGFQGIARDITGRKQAEMEIRQRLSELEVLYQSGFAFSQPINSKAIAEKIIGLLEQEMDWHHTAIRLYNPENATLELLAFNLPHLNSQVERDAAEKRFRSMELPDQGLTGWVIQHSEVIRSNDLKNDPRYFETFPGLQSGLYVPIKLNARVIGVISIESELPDAFNGLDERLVMTLATQAAIAIDNAQLFESLKYLNLDLTAAYDATIEGWSRALDLRDKETEGHSLRVTAMALKLARAFGLSEDELAQVRWGALLHDIGKMGVPDGILLKPGALTDEEWVEMKKHPTFAYELLSPIHYLRSALDIPYCHHEKWDGTGYPRGLKDAEIPLVARIFSVVDVWDALISDRPYRPAWLEEKVSEHIHNLSGTHFDPYVVDIFMKMINGKDLL